MAPMKRPRADGDVLAIEIAGSSLNRNHGSKAPRLSLDHQSASRIVRQRSPSTSSDEDEDDAVPDEEYVAPPASTQYEIMRDDGFKHLQHPDLDDELATQRFLRRNELIGENHAAENAIIQEITCINFMCHDRLHVELGPLINFVVGMNGSGKSAILTAVTLCLGGKAASTNRGASLKSLIKSGKDQSVLIVKLKNEGQDAYQPDVYGKSIIIERHFSRSGSTGYKLKNENNRLVSPRKGDVDDIIEYYQLQVDNPMNVLTQDAAKSFITKSTPAEKYKFFVEGVQLEALDNDYKLVSDTCDQIAGKLLDSKSDIDVLKKNCDEAGKKWNIVQRHEGMRARARLLGKQAAWAQVEEVEKQLEEREEQASQAQSRIVQQEREIAEKGDAYETANKALERAKELERQVDEEVVPIKDEEATARSAFDESTKEVERIRTARNQAKRDITTGTKKVEGYKKDIAEEEARLEATNGGAQARMFVEIKEAEEAAAEAKRAREEHNLGNPKLEEDRKAAVDDQIRLETSLDNKQNEIAHLQDRIRELSQGRGDIMANYDQKIPNLLRAIQNERGFRERPVGPIGTHLKLKDPVWSNTIETALGNHLNAFIVTCKSDQQLFTNIKRRLGMDWVMVMIGNHHPIDTSRSEPDAQYMTIDKVLEIDNDLVRNQLIIGQAIEQSLLIQSRSEGERVMFRGLKPQNVKQCFTLHDQRRDTGHRMAWNGRSRNQETGPVKYNLRQKPRMKTDNDTQVAFMQESLVPLEREKGQLQNELNQARARKRRCEAAIVQHKRDFQDLKVKIQRADDHIETLQAKLDKDTVEDGRLDGLKESLGEAEKELAISGEGYGSFSLELNTANEEAYKRKQDLEAVKIHLADHDNKARKAVSKVARFSQARKIALQDKNLAIEMMEEFRNAKNHAERKRDQQANQVANFIEQATKISARIPIDEGETAASLDQKLMNIKKDIREYQRKQGGTDQEIQDAFEKAKLVYDTAKQRRAELEDLLQTLKESFQKRMKMFRKFQRYISSRSRINFNYLLSERMFRGKLNIDHIAKKLDVHVEPDNTTKTGKGRQTKTLSGGEKSFSSICLLLALWEAMGAPLRCLDEYDVYMDDVNRDVSSNMIITAARRSVGRQFILITPKALGAGAGGDADDVKITKLRDPRERGQQGIEEALQD